MTELSLFQDNRKTLEHLLVTQAIQAILLGIKFANQIEFGFIKGRYEFNPEERSLDIAIALNYDTPEMTQYAFTPAKPGGKTEDGYVWCIDCEELPAFSTLECRNGLHKSVKLEAKIAESLVKKIQEIPLENWDETPIEIILTMPKKFSETLKDEMDSIVSLGGIELVYKENVDDNVINVTNTMLLKATVYGIKSLVAKYYQEAIVISMNFHCPNMMDKPKT